MVGGTLVVFPLGGPGVHEGVGSFPAVDIGLPAIVMGRRRARIQPVLGQRMPALTGQCSADTFDQPCRGEWLVRYVEHFNPGIGPPIRANLFGAFNDDEFLRKRHMRIGSTAT